MKLDTMKGLRRTHYCGEVPETEQEVVVCGFADRVRDMGNLIFINLRDRTGLVQLAFNDETDRAVFEKAQLVKSEYVLMAKGMVRPRESVNLRLLIPSQPGLLLFVGHPHTSTRTNTPQGSDQNS